MARASSLKLQAGEHCIAVIRRHWWFAVRPLVWLVPILSLLPLYALADYCWPGAGLARHSVDVDIAIIAMAGLVLLKWLVRDILAWAAASWVLTDLRLIEQRGLAGMRRREAFLHSARLRGITQHGLRARILGYGDLVVEVEGRGSFFTLSRVARPRELEAALQSLIQQAQDERRRLNGVGDGRIQAALSRVFRGGTGEHDTPTIELEQITPLMLAAQRRLVGSTILYATHRHPIVFARNLLIEVVLSCIAFLALWVLQPVITVGMIAAFAMAVALWFFWLVLDWKTCLYVLTSERVVRLHGPLAFRRGATSIALREIRDVVACSAPISGRLMNIGSIVLERRAVAPVTLDAVPDPDRLKRLIHGGMEAAAEQARIADQEHLAGDLAEWFEQYHLMQESP